MSSSGLGGMGMRAMSMGHISESFMKRNNTLPSPRIGKVNSSEGYGNNGNGTPGGNNNNGTGAYGMVDYMNW